MIDVKLDHPIMAGEVPFADRLRSEDVSGLGAVPCLESNLSFDEFCERARFGLAPRSFVFAGCKDIVERAMAKSVPYLSRAYGVLDRGDLYNQAYIMVMEQFGKWNPWQAPFRQYLALTLHLRLRAYITSVKHHGKDRTLREVTASPADMSGEFDGDADDEAQVLSPAERMAAAQDDDVLGNIVVKDILGRLPERHSRVFAAHVFEDKYFDEIGLELGISGSTALGYYGRTVAWLRRYMTDPERTPPMATAMLRGEKVIGEGELLGMVRFMAERSCTEKDAYAAGYPHRTWRMANKMLRGAGLLKTKAVHGGGRRSYLAAPLEECLEYIEGAFSGEEVTPTDVA